MTAHQWLAWPGPADHAAVWWAGVAALLCVALLVALQSVLQRSVDQGQMRLVIKATQLSEARHCTTLVGSRVQELCLLALNETARVGAESALAEPTAQIHTTP
jgi:hypothetical protein